MKSSKDNKIFSVPLYVNLKENEFIILKDFLKKHSDYIFDIYFTYGLPPFNDDAYGGVGYSKSMQSISANLDSILSIQTECNIRISATFNNIYVDPCQDNLDMFIKNFGELYDKGIHSITLPFSSWVFSKELRKNFPDLFIKNTVMWKVNSAREFWNLAETGFDYINLDRTLLRNQKMLNEIKNARNLFHKKTGKYILISILANEYPCSGYCPFREEHSALAASNSYGVNMFPSVFNICLYNQMNSSNANYIKMNFLKMAFVPPFEDDYNKLTETIDVFKMFGRIQSDYFKESLNQIEEYAKGKGLLQNILGILEDENNHPKSKKLLVNWKKAITNCNFNCWQCNICDQLYDSLSNENKTILQSYKLY